MPIVQPKSVIEKAMQTQGVFLGWACIALNVEQNSLVEILQKNRLLDESVFKRTYLGRYFNEAELLKILRHENIVEKRVFKRQHLIKMHSIKKKEGG